MLICAAAPVCATEALAAWWRSAVSVRCTMVLLKEGNET